MSAKILVADDEEKIAKMVATYLEASGFRPIVAYDGLQALHAFREHLPDCIILDINMPGLYGIDVAREVRKTSSVPIIFLTARADELDRIVGLELGADDYISKPFSPKELVARVRAILRRTMQSVKDTSQVELLQHGPVEIDLKKRLVRVFGETKDLTTIQIDILSFLIREPGRVYSRMEILEACIGSTYEGYERTVDAHIKNIRKALGDDSNNPKFIATVRGAGYKFMEQSE